MFQHDTIITFVCFLATWSESFHEIFFKVFLRKNKLETKSVCFNFNSLKHMRTGIVEKKFKLLEKSQVLKQSSKKKEVG